VPDFARVEGFIMKLQVLENRLVFDGAFGADVFIENEVFDTDAADHVSAVAFDEQIASDRTEIAVIDTSIDDYETLASNIPTISILYTSMAPKMEWHSWKPS